MTDAGRTLIDEAVVDHLATEETLLDGLPQRTRQRLASDLGAWLAALLTAAEDDGSAVG